MKYLSFSLENYKGIKENVTMNIEDENQFLSCLIGNNESGKTTILKGIEIIGKLCSGIKYEKDEVNKFQPRSSTFSGDTIFKAKICFDSSEIDKLTKKIQEILKLNNYIIIVSFKYKFSNTEWDKQCHSEIENLDNKYVSVILDVIKKNTPSIIYYEDFKFKVPEKIRFLENENSKTKNLNDSKNTDANKQVSTEDKKTKDNLKNELLISPDNRFWQQVFNDLLVGGLYSNSDEPHTFQSEIVDKKDNDDVLNQRIEDINKYLNKVVNRDWEDITGSGAEFDRFYIKKKETNGCRDFDDYTLKAKSLGHVFSISERSKGCQWYFCFKVYTEIQSKGKRNNGIIFLLDEPASNLHIYPQEKILESLKKLLDTAGNTSVIYSTHSPYLIDTNNKDHTYIIENQSNDTKDSSKIKCVKCCDYKGDFKCIEPILNKMILDAITEKEADNSKKFKKFFEIFKLFSSKLQEKSETVEGVSNVILKNYEPIINNINEASLFLNQFGN